MPRIASTPCPSPMANRPAIGDRRANPSAPRARPQVDTNKETTSTPTSSCMPEWAHWPNEIREHVACRMTARDLAAFSSTSRANLGLARSPHVIVRQRPEEAMRSLWHLANVNAADAVRQLARMPDAKRIDWGRRNTEGATLLMSAFQRCSPEVIDALMEGPVELFAGLDNKGNNILHYVVEHADTARLDRLLTINPDLAAYIDLPGNLAPKRYGLIYPNNDRRTPLACAYRKRDDALVARMASESVDAVERAIQQREMHGRDTASVRYEPLKNVFPFDRRARPIEGAHARACLSGFDPSRDAAHSRLKVAFDAIVHREFAILEKLLMSLPPTVLHAQREPLLRLAMGVADFPSVRVIANHYGAQLFTPLSNDETVLHLAAEQAEPSTLSWLLRQSGHEPALNWRDDEGCTPLLTAAKHANEDCLELFVDFYPDRLIGDVDIRGRGLLRTLSETRPDVAAELFRCMPLASWVDRITPSDKTATLCYALYSLVALTKFRAPSLLHQGRYSALLEIIEHLLAQPRGEIDIFERISPAGPSIIDVLRSGRLTELVALDGRLGEKTPISDFQRSCEDYDNARYLSLAHAHL